MKRITGFFLFFFLFLLTTPSVSAHEAYVLTQSEFQQGLTVFSQNPLAPLLDPNYIGITTIITICLACIYLINFLWAATNWSAFLDALVKKAHVVGPLIIRLAISSSFFYAAYANAILGPELSLTHVSGGAVIRFLLFTLSIMIFFGFLTELAACVGLILFFYITFTFQAYMITYVNYFGELLVLFLFGSRFFSLDHLFFGKKILVVSLRNYRFLEVPIVRIFYGIALIYAGWTIKFAHQALSIAVYNQYHLINFFHAPANYIAAGAGLSEIAIGIFILFGFAQRLTIIISLIFITLSIVYFREMLWPHFMLYGISFSLIINSADKLTLDRFLVPFVKQALPKFFKKRKTK